MGTGIYLFGNVFRTPDASIPAAVDNYHTDYDSGDSHTSLDLFRESPARYAAIRVFRTMQPDPPSASLTLGLALHALLFEYDKEYRYAVRKKSPIAKRIDLWTNPLALATVKNPLSDQEARLLFKMFVAITAEPDAWNLLVEQPGYNERVFTARDLGDGMMIKCKPDRVLQNGLVVDLKTVDGPVDPESWSRTLFRWGYHRQAAFYLDVLALAGQKVDRFVFVAVSKGPPHEIGIYLCDEESVEQGRRENRELLERLAECRRSGIWKHEWQGKILTVGVPRWAIDR